MDKWNILCYMYDRGLVDNNDFLTKSQPIISGLSYWNRINCYLMMYQKRMMQKEEAKQKICENLGHISLTQFQEDYHTVFTLFDSELISKEEMIKLCNKAIEQ